MIVAYVMAVTLMILAVVVLKMAHQAVITNVDQQQLKMTVVSAMVMVQAVL